MLLIIFLMLLINSATTGLVLGRSIQPRFPHGFQGQIMLLLRRAPHPCAC